MLNQINIKWTKQAHTFKGYGSSYNLAVLNSFNAELQIEDTESAIKSNIIDLLAKLNGFEFVEMLVLVFKNIGTEDKTKYETFYSNSKARKAINESGIDDVLQSICAKIISKIQKSFGKCSG